MGKALEMEDELTLWIWNSIQSAVFSISESFEELRCIGLGDSIVVHSLRLTACLGTVGTWSCLN